MKLLIYSDGACSGNGTGRAVICGSYAAYEVDPDTNWRGERAVDSHLDLSARETPIELRRRVPLPVNETERATNNLAEAKTLEMALAWASNYIKGGSKYAVVEICMDSQLVMNQLQGIYTTNNAPLRKVYGRVLKLLDTIESRGAKVRWTWIPGDLMKRTIIAH